MCEKSRHRFAAGLAPMIVSWAWGPAWAQPADAAHRQVQFLVVAPTGAEVDATQILCALSIDGWKPEGRKLTRLASGVYSATWPLPVGQPVEYKFLRVGVWKAVEKGPQGEEIPNRKLTVPPAGPAASPLLVVHVVERWADHPGAVSPQVQFPSDNAPPAAAAAAPSTKTGDIRTHRDFPTLTHPRRRSLHVLLPPDYEASRDARFPVLYMHDGQNLFDAGTSAFGVEWQVDETLARLWTEGRIEPMIVVAVENTTARMEEYTPWPDAKGQGGGADDYLTFLVREVKPFIDQHYRTSADREHTAIVGSSLGGLVSLHAVLRYPGVFGRAGCLSTTLMWADWGVVEEAGRYQGPCPIRMWVDVDQPTESPAGLAEAAAHLKAKLDELGRALAKRGCCGEGSCTFEQASGPHHESAWAARFERVIVHLFPTAAGHPLTEAQEE